MSVHILDQAIIASLKHLFEEAEGSSLWFFHHSIDHDDLWCSPEFLRLEQSRGRLILAPEHWELRDPSGCMKKLLKDSQVLVNEYNEMARRRKFEETIEITSHSSNAADAR
jgi:hypothetical protein